MSDPAIDPAPAIVTAAASVSKSGIRYAIETLDTIDSTSSELKRRAESRGDIDGVVVVADTQTAGRGRMGRSWIDQPGGSLLFSIGWRAPIPAAKLSGLSLAIGVAIVDAMHRDGVAGLQLKWPNDLVHKSRKLGGILIETVNARDGEIDVIIGIGINLRLDLPARDEVSGSVIALTDLGWDGDRRILLDRMLDSVAAILERFPREGFVPWRQQWIGLHAHQQRSVTIWRAGREIAAGRAIDVDDDGALLLQTSAGVRRFTSGESTLRTR